MFLLGFHYKRLPFRARASELGGIGLAPTDPRTRHPPAGRGPYWAKPSHGIANRQHGNKSGTPGGNSERGPPTSFSNCKYSVVRVAPRPERSLPSAACSEPLGVDRRAGRAGRGLFLQGRGTIHTGASWMCAAQIFQPRRAGAEKAFPAHAGGRFTGPIPWRNLLIPGALYSRPPTVCLIAGSLMTRKPPPLHIFHRSAHTRPAPRIFRISSFGNRVPASAAASTGVVR